ncbi:RNA polymerase sigma factor [Sediminibacterium ginsengisoli]|uniref:RNA polymerase sigma-70 factor, ECF subfamily n=1 Tax=Sediminibacterium ginsengisoli TaxID=413434 RepID=A0A1T4R2S1_9BACT|nr:sigma-70 family RNA polymerase sigma factor [Sediminibacterium ginsengisoli]SKA10342.1 RNA polymerase sigma-70 factor, ECF subfamily [Sediminibacterium ginsengisoli]
MPAEKDFIILLNQHQKIIHKVCNLYMDAAADREDLFQEITLQAWKAYGNFRGDAKFSTWLYRVALNTAITYFRKEKKKPEIFTSEHLPEDRQAETTDPVEEQVKALYAAIGDLSRIDKAIVMLYLEDYSYNEIGDMMGITANNVAVKMNRIKTKLREQTPKHMQTA